MNPYPHLKSDVEVIKETEAFLTSLNLKLTPDLIPETAWGQNLRSTLTKTQWDYVRHFTYRRADFTCEFCGAHCNTRGSAHAHEIWKWDIDTCTQTLNKVACVCEKCHLAIHFGFANVKGKTAQSVSQFVKVNGLSELPEDSLEQIYNEISRLWYLRSRFLWHFDAKPIQDWLEKYNIH